LNKKILSIQNIECETLGTLKELFETDGYQIDNIQPSKQPIPSTLEEYSAVVILGGPMGVHDNIDNLKQEENIIRYAIKKDFPLLGICLGSQLIAKTLGGNVYKGTKKEIGWSNVFITENGHKNLFRGFEGNTIRVFQWHGDTYDLPTSATLLAYSKLYPQAFKIGNLIGIQFHLEVNHHMIENWLHEYREEASEENIEPESILPNGTDNSVEDLYHTCRTVYSNFSKLI
jgi:GMP synthase-like glutamine amidotransferase